MRALSDSLSANINANTYNKVHSPGAWESPRLRHLEAGHTVTKSLERTLNTTWLFDNGFYVNGDSFLQEKVYSFKQEHVNR